MSLSLTDDDTGSTTGATTVRVYNVAPAITNLSELVLINENDYATITGTINDPGTLDALTLVVSWGD